MIKNNEPVIIEQAFECSIEKVWSAITDLELMHQWFFENIPAFKPVAGFETEFKVESGGRVFTHVWKIIDAVPQKKITYHWSYAEYPGRGYVDFELSAKYDITKLRLTNRIVENFPQDIPEFARESCIAGWEYFINKRLKEFLIDK